MPENKPFTPFGVIPAMVTPLTAQEELNIPVLRQLTNFLIDNGVHGLFAVGSQGEFWALTKEEKQRVWEVVVEETNGRVPVYAGTAAVTTHEAVELTQLAESCGVDAVSVLTPYFISPNESELEAHYRAVAAGTRLPVLLYTNPARTGVRISPALAARLSQVDNIVGAKDSAGDLEAAAELMRAAGPDFAILMGRDTLIYGGLLYGAKGAIAATANVAPALVASIYNCFQGGDYAAARQAQQELALLRGAFTLGTFPVVVKEALEMIGIPAGPARAPVGPLSSEQRARLKSVLTEMRLM